MFEQPKRRKRRPPFGGERFAAKEDRSRNSTAFMQPGACAWFQLSPATATASRIPASTLGARIGRNRPPVESPAFLEAVLRGVKPENAWKPSRSDDRCIPPPFQVVFTHAPGARQLCPPRLKPPLGAFTAPNRPEFPAKRLILRQLTAAFGNDSFLRRNRHRCDQSPHGGGIAASPVTMTPANADRRR